MWFWTCSKLLSGRQNLVINHQSVRGALFCNTACNTRVYFGIARSLLFSELLQYSLPNLIVGNIMKVGGHHSNIFMCS